MRITIMAIGSRGDAQPLPLGRAYNRLTYRLVDGLTT